LRPAYDPPVSSTIVYYATCSGGSTVDVDAEGGNPFASALLEVAADDGLELRSLGERLREATRAKSSGIQAVEWAGEARLSSWRIGAEPRPGERRSALVLVVSDYSGLGAPTLTGAARDERRIAAMLAQHGFSVEQGVGARRRDLVDALAAFRRRSRRADVAVVYSTGHGIEVGGVVHLLPGDYPIRNGLRAADLRRHAVGVPRMMSAASAAKQNLVFFAGCRSHVRDDGDADLDELRRPS
jgi:hypothetical protein